MQEFKIKTERKYTKVSMVIPGGEGVGVWVIIIGSLIFYVDNFFQSAYTTLIIERHPK